MVGVGLTLPAPCYLTAAATNKPDSTKGRKILNEQINKTKDNNSSNNNYNTKKN